MEPETPVPENTDSETWEACLERLTRGTDALGVALPAGAARAMIDFLVELASWNRAYNLTAVHRPDEMVDRHLLDSLSLIPYLQGERIADAGSGAGLPGIPLAIARPRQQFVLVDSRRKRILFMRHVARTLNLANVEVIHARVEDYRAGRAGFDTVTARAFARLDRLLALCAHLCVPGGRILAMKGRDPEVELRGVDSGFKVLGVHTLEVPGLRGERHLVIISPQTKDSI